MTVTTGEAIGSALKVKIDIHNLDERNTDVSNSCSTDSFFLCISSVDRKEDCWEYWALRDPCLKRTNRWECLLKSISKNLVNKYAYKILLILSGTLYAHSKQIKPLYQTLSNARVLSKKYTVQLPLFSFTF